MMSVDAIFFICLGVFLTIGAIIARGRFASFVGQVPANYEDGQAGRFDIRTHLNGPIQCDGVIYGPLGRVTSRFEADFECHWTGNTGVMHETFRYDDGSVQNRAWQLTLGEGGKILARADDVVGDGTGVQSGDAVQLKYKLRLPETAGGHVLDVVDWMYLTPAGTIINRSQFRKFGIQVAELVATMRPAPMAIKKAA